MTNEQIDQSRHEHTSRLYDRLKPIIYDEQDISRYHSDAVLTVLSVLATQAIVGIANATDSRAETGLKLARQFTDHLIERVRSNVMPC